MSTTDSTALADIQASLTDVQAGLTSVAAAQATVTQIGGHHPVLVAELAAAATVLTASETKLKAAISTLTPAPAPAGLYLNPALSPVVEYKALVAAGNTTDAALIEKIASQPIATWITSDSQASEVASLIGAAKAANEIPLLVIYNIPDRDNGGASSGGSASVQTYEAFINAVATGLGAGSDAWIVLEPDALDDDAVTANTTTIPCLQYAYKTLKATGAKVYVDASNPGWESATTVAALLNQVGAGVDFAVNVSNFYPSAACITYGEAVSAAAGGGHFVIDTSRNGGAVKAGDWENPAGALLGANPTTATSNPLVDGELWIKIVGESDGPSTSTTLPDPPAAGTFWLPYALMLCGETPPTPPTPTSPVPLGISGYTNPPVLYYDFTTMTSLEGTVFQPYWWNQGGKLSGPCNKQYENNAYSSDNITFDSDGLCMLLEAEPNVAPNVGVTLPYTGALVSSNPDDGRPAGSKSFQFTYGVAEVRIYVPGNAAGQIANWPAWWQTTAPQYSYHETDTLEVLSGTAQAHYHNDSEAPGITPSFVITPGWHTLANEWTPEGITFYYDGNAIGTIPATDSNQPQYLVLNNSIAKEWLPTSVPATLKCSHIGVWQTA